MKLVVNINLAPTEAQYAALLETLKVANRACTWLAGQAWDTKTFGQFAPGVCQGWPMRRVGASLDWRRK